MTWAKVSLLRIVIADQVGIHAQSDRWVSMAEAGRDYMDWVPSSSKVGDPEPDLAASQSDGLTNRRMRPASPVVREGRGDPAPYPITDLPRQEPVSIGRTGADQAVSADSACPAGPLLSPAKHPGKQAEMQ